MTIYDTNQRWKLWLAVIGMVIMALSFAYTYWLANKLSQRERSEIEQYIQALETLSFDQNTDFNSGDYTLHAMVLEDNTTIPVLVVDERGEILMARNFGEARDTNMVYLRSALRELKAEGPPPIAIGVGFGNNYAYYRHSYLLDWLRWFPVVQSVLLVSFALLGYWAFSSARRAEQNQVWVGMAKETAHQLGTPISGIIGWLETLKLYDDPEDVHEAVDEMSKDVQRLEMIADRFSKIGSQPELEVLPIYPILHDSVSYFQSRKPRKVTLRFPVSPEQPLQAAVNPPLFKWVLENLLRNGLDALEGSGELGAELFCDADYLYIDVTDTGKGIPEGKFKTVFKPGYSTKKRGWGLGLSLAERIIKSYHNGKIFVKQSTPDVGTTFRIEIPRYLTAEEREEIRKRLLDSRPTLVE